jgi:hypothetical protein
MLSRLCILETTSAGQACKNHFAQRRTGELMRDTYANGLNPLAGFFFIDLFGLKREPLNIKLVRKAGPDITPNQTGC